VDASSLRGTGPAVRALTGAFVDAELERAFLEEHTTSVRLASRWPLLVATTSFLAYSVHDWLVVPEILRLALTLRFALFAPVALLTLALTYVPKRPVFHELSVLAYGVCINTVVLAIGVAARSTEGFFLYTAYAILFVTLGPFVAKMTVLTQAAYTALTLTAFQLVLALQTPVASPLAVVSTSLTLVCMGLIACVLAHQTGSLARAAFVQRRLIEEQVVALDREKAKSDALLLNILPASVAARLKEDGRTIADGFAQITVLFSDIVGFTGMSDRLPPDEVVRRLNAIFSRFDALADVHDVEKIKTIGDAYMVAGGLTGRRTDHAQAVVAMAIDMQRALRELAPELGEELRVRIGIHTGPVVAGVIGTKKFVYDIWGDTVNMASRMESHGIAGRTQLSEATARLLGDAYPLEPRGEIDLKGKGLVRAFLLVDETEGD
jgi:class 3 adenylate cyclase